MQNVIGIQIRELMREEFGEFGENILNKQCLDMGIIASDIRVEDVDELSDRIFHAVRNMAGIDKSQRIRSYIKKYKLLGELKELENHKPDDIKSSKECRILMELGFISTNNLGDAESAIEYYSKASKIAKSLGHKDQIIRCKKGISFVHLERCDLKEAEIVAKKVLDMYNEEKLDDNLVECKRCIALCRWRKGEYEEALDILSEVKDLYEELEDKSGLALSYKNLGDIYGEKEDFEESLKNYEKSAELFGAEKNHLERTTLFMNMGVIYSIKKDWANAATYYLKSESISRKKRFPNRLAWILFNLGEAYTYLHEFDKAEDAFKESMDIFYNQNDTMGQSGANIKYGQMFVEKKEYEKAEPLLKRGIEILRGFDVPRYLADAVHELGKAQGNMGRTEDARKNFEEALEIYRSIDNESRVKMVEDDLEKLTKSLK